eukprot:536815-Amphidinium_carterae.1
MQVAQHRPHALVVGQFSESDPLGPVCGHAPGLPTHVAPQSSPRCFVDGLRPPCGVSFDCSVQTQQRLDALCSASPAAGLVQTALRTKSSSSPVDEVGPF